MQETTNNSVSKKEPWMRLLYMVLFLFINNLLKGVVIIMAAAQFLHLVVKGDFHNKLALYSQGLSNYSYTITRFVTYISDKKPFPFSPWDNNKPS
jgi:hypothetical protein